MVQRTYYRPEWTCGRYNDNAKVALMYNLIEGKSFFFESYSAMVIGEILSVHKNSDVSIADISGKLDIATESLSPFFCISAELRSRLSTGIICSESG